MDFSKVRVVRLDATNLLAKQAAVAVWLVGSAQPLYFAQGSALAQEVVRFSKCASSYERFLRIGSCLFERIAIIREETDGAGATVIWLQGDPVEWRFVPEANPTVHLATVPSASTVNDVAVATDSTVV